MGNYSYVNIINLRCILYRSGSKEVIFMKRQKTFQMALLGLFSALIILMSLTPIGYIRTGIVSITLVHLPVIIGAILLGWQGGLVLGGVMGVLSMIIAYVMPGGAMDVFFQNPLVAIPSRMALGLITGLLFAGFSKIIRGRAKTAASIGLAAAIGKLCSTVLTLSMLVVVYHNQIAQLTHGSAISFLIGSIITINGLVEMVAGVLIAIPVCTALFKAQRKLICINGN
ncbi:MAG TPA: hypothetical protein DHW78_06985 [Ruminococcaceae bacterium]|nr:hypothetical protein [Oscillospiraceae bacterium]HCC01785.1 hypothetical protein [Oscillospiraceae bacterium]HCM24049.1 hypothetical protein [Oscillospiraceae bacterium]